MSLKPKISFYNLPSDIQYLIFEFKGDQIPFDSLDDNFEGLKLKYCFNQISKLHQYFTSEISSSIVRKAWIQAVCNVQYEPTTQNIVHLAVKILLDNLPNSKAKAIKEKWGIYSLSIKKVKEIESILDESLELIWERVCTQLTLFGNHDSFYDAESIRRWLHNPSNQVYIDKVIKLDLSGLDLDIMPPEINCFKNILELNLSDNNLNEVYFLETLNKLITLNLNNNKVTDLSFLQSLKSIWFIHINNKTIKKVL